ncbi:Fic family protein [Candidatus Pacearchaeota archaeon]|nr:Fic family protein [Candidatus Pacearchaeota archaeon]
MPIDHALIEEIDKKQLKILEDPNYYLVRKSRIQSHQENPIAIFSWWIEHPNERMEFLIHKPGTKEHRQLFKIAKEGVKKIEEAWAYLLEEPNYLTLSVAGNLAFKVEPFKNKIPYRTSRVSLNLEEYCPPNYEKVRDLLSKTFNNINQGELHPVEKAAMAHLYTAAIQPFNDGNKRVGRLLQNRILHDADYLPVLQPAGERAVYIDLLEQGCVGWRDNDLKKQRPFFDYIGGKVNTTLDEVLGDLHEVEVKYTNHNNHH